MQKINKNHLQLFIILLFSLIVYLPILPNEFVWDDQQFFRDWKTIQTFNNIPKLLAGDTPLEHIGVYRPVRSLLYTLSYQINRDNPIGYRIQAIVLHLLGTSLVFFITKKLATYNFQPTTHNLLPFITALLFGIHPIHTENIAFATASFDLFGLIFFLLSVYFFLSKTYNRLPTTDNFLLSILFAFLAFFTTELTLSLPLILLTLSIATQKHILFRKHYFKVALYFGIALLYLGIRYQFIPQTARATFIGGSLSLTLQIASEALLRYIQMLIVPIGLSVAPQFAHGITTDTILQGASKPFTFISIFPIVVGFVLMCLLTISVYLWNKHRIISISFLWFLLSLLPVSNIIPTGTLYAERYLYVASFGFCLLLGYAISVLTSYKTYRLSAFSFLILLMCVWSILTTSRNRDWNTDISLWKSAYAVSPQSPAVLTNLGVAYKNKKDNFQALMWYQKALTIDPSFARAHNNIGIILVDEKKYTEALVSFEQALTLSPSNSTIAANAAEMYLKLGQPIKAQEKLIIAVTNAPKNPQYWFNLANIYIRINQPQKAIDAFSKAMTLDSTDTKIHNNLATVLLSINDYYRAIKVLKNALMIDKNDPNIFFSLGTAYELSNNYTDAQSAYKEALLLQPDFAAAKIRLEKIQTTD